MKFEIAIFDLDGVLTETSEQHYQAWKSLADSLELPFDRQVNERLKGVSRMESLDIILSHGGVSNRYSPEEKERLATEKNDLYKELISHISPENLFPGVRELLDQLQAKNIKIALASASHNAPALLDQMGISHYFDYVVNPSSVAKGKPAPDIFLKAATELAIDPAKAVGFEDAVAGVKAIKSAGMYAVGIGDSSILNQADVVYPAVEDVPFSLLLEE